MEKTCKLFPYRSPEVTTVLKEEYMICSSGDQTGAIDETLIIEGEEIF